MITDLATLRAALVTGHLPPSITGGDPAKLQRIGRELVLATSEGNTAIEELARVRATLVAFGALDPNDHATGTADLVAALLPASVPA